MKGLSTRQFEIMDILWKSTQPMTASQILSHDASLNINTVQASLRSLIKKEYIRLADIVYSGTVLTRSYEPIVTKEAYMKQMFMPDFGSSRYEVFVSVIQEETDIKALEYLESVIADRKAKLKK